MKCFYLIPSSPKAILLAQPQIFIDTQSLNYMQSSCYPAISSWLIDCWLYCYWHHDMLVYFFIGNHSEYSNCLNLLQEPLHIHPDTCIMPLYYAGSTVGYSSGVVRGGNSILSSADTNRNNGLASGSHDVSNYSNNSYNTVSSEVSHLNISTWVFAIIDLLKKF